MWNARWRQWRQACTEEMYPGCIQAPSQQFQGSRAESLPMLLRVMWYGTSTSGMTCRRLRMEERPLGPAAQATLPDAASRRTRPPAKVVQSMSRPWSNQPSSTAATLATLPLAAAAMLPVDLPQAATLSTSSRVLERPYLAIKVSRLETCSRQIIEKPAAVSCNHSSRLTQQ